MIRRIALNTDKDFGEAFLFDSGIKEIVGQENIVFCFLYLTSDYFTLAWNGELDFSQLERIVLMQLPKKINLGVDSYTVSDVDNYIIKASLIVTGDEDDRLVKYCLGEPNQENRHDYHDAISNKHRSISFARYDIQHKGSSKGFSFSGENYKNIRCKESYSEIAVKQPMGQILTNHLLKWMVCTHKSAYRLSNMNIQCMIQSINDCIYN